MPTYLNRSADGEAPKGPSKNELKKRAKEEEKARKAAEKAAKQAELEAQKAAAEVVRASSSQPAKQSECTNHPPLLRSPMQDFATELYGKLPLNQSQSRPGRKRTPVASLSPDLDGQTVLVRARVQASRAQGSKMVFLNLRQRTDSVQALLVLAQDKVSKQMIKWAAGLQTESIVLAEGVVKKAPEPINSATVQDVELHLTQVIWHVLFAVLSHGLIRFSATAAPYFRPGHQASVHCRGCESS